MDKSLYKKCSLESDLKPLKATKMTSRIVTLITFSLIMFVRVFSQELDNKPSIALLGTVHFAGSSDVMALQANDILGENRQSEIQDLIESLFEYNPTKIVLEFPYGDYRLDSLYQLYREGSGYLSINERQQIGFRLAKKLRHDHIFVADHHLDLPFQKLTEYLQRTNQMQKMQEFMDYIKENAIDTMQHAYDNMSLKEFFVFINQEQFDAENKNLYLSFLNPIGAGDGDVGLEITTAWWKRNFKIMQNIDQIMDENDRVLVLFGQGHTAILKDIYSKRTDVEYVDILKYLTN